MSHASYLQRIFSVDEFQNTVKLISEIITEKFSDVDYIAGAGISGALILGAVSIATEKEIFFVRKENDDSHSFKSRGDSESDFPEKYCEFTNIDKKVQTAIIIDDLISSGNTVRRVVDKLWRNDILIVGIILYDETGRDWNFHDADKNLSIPVISVDKAMD